MTAQKASEAEPTMEEILASIRRIISEDAEPGAKSEAAGPAGAPAPPAPEPEAEADEEIMELTEVLAEEVAEPRPEAEPHGMADQDDELMLVEDQPPREDPMAQTDYEDTESLLSQRALSAASNALGALAPDARIAEGESRSLEALVREMLRPVLREWLEDNLPALVEEIVEKEVRRLATRVRRR